LKILKNLKMKLPKTLKRYCPYCKKHTEHKVSQTKKKNPRSMTYGSKVRAKRRGSARGIGNRGRYSKPAISKFKRTGKKMSKKTDLRYECKECKKTHMQKKGFRAKKIEFK
jgi:large subunit ribosomal protein L44e